MAFCTKMQAYLVDRFYHYTYEKYPKQTKEAVLTAFRHYVNRRGLRSAQRAIRDHEPLNFMNYQKYREVVFTPELRAADGPSRGQHVITEEAFVGVTFECATHTLFRELNSPEEVEQLFCQHVDRYNVEGFNADLTYEVVSTLYQSPACIHRAPNPGIKPGEKMGERAADAPPFPFIIASQYYSMKEIMVAIFGEEGKQIAEQVKQDFISYFSEEDWQEIEKYQKANFDIYYPKCME